MVGEHVPARSKGTLSLMLMVAGVLLLLIAIANVFNVDRQSNLVLALLGVTGIILLSLGIRQRR